VSRGRKPSYLPICGGVCDGYRKNRCIECTSYHRRIGAGGSASRGINIKEEPALSQIDVIRANPHLAWTDNQKRRAGLVV
jgi:hypothetical protein